MGHCYGGKAGRSLSRTSLLTAVRRPYWSASCTNYQYVLVLQSKDSNRSGRAGKEPLPSAILAILSPPASPKSRVLDSTLNNAQQQTLPSQQLSKLLPTSQFSRPRNGSRTTTTAQNNRAQSCTSTRRPPAQPSQAPAADLPSQQAVFRYVPVLSTFGSTRLVHRVAGQAAEAPKPRASGGFGALPLGWTRQHGANSAAAQGVVTQSGEAKTGVAGSGLSVSSLGQDLLISSHSASR